MSDDSVVVRSHHVECEASGGLDRELLRKLGQPTPWRLAAAVLFEWTLILAAIGLAVSLDALAATALAVVFIATRQHALLVLMHEFSHRHFSRAHPVLNDVLGDFFCALPFTVTIHGYRRDHTAHHRFTSTPEDPNWVLCQIDDRFAFPQTASKTARLMAKHMTGFYGMRELKWAWGDAKMASECPAGTCWRQGLFAIAVVVGLSWFGAWQIWAVYWLVPMLTVLIAILYWRDVAEHFALPHEGVLASRTMLPRWWERLLVAPHHVGYHTEHHLYPAVPSGRLPQLHAQLLRDPAYAANTVLTRGYFSGLLHETTRFGADRQAHTATERRHPAA